MSMHATTISFESIPPSRDELIKLVSKYSGLAVSLSNGNDSGLFYELKENDKSSYFLCFTDFPEIQIFISNKMGNSNELFIDCFYTVEPTLHYATVFALLAHGGKSHHKKISLERYNFPINTAELTKRHLQWSRRPLHSLYIFIAFAALLLLISAIVRFL